MTKKFKRRAAILQEANRLFTDRGFSATSLEDIAEAVGIKRESLYYYYPSRYDLLYDIIAPQITKVIKNFEEITMGEQAFSKIVERGIDNHLQQFNSSYLHMAMAVRKNSKDDVQLKFIKLRDMFKSYENIWIGVIDKSYATGEIEGQIPPRMLAYSILGLCNSLSNWYRPDGDLSLSQIGQHFSHIILDGLISP